MRYQPPLVHRIARETAAEVVVNAALAHAFERMFYRFEKTRGGFVGGRARNGFQKRAGWENLGGPRSPPLTESNILPIWIAAAVSSFRPIVTLPAGRALSASRERSAARFCSILFGSSRNSRATSRNTSTKAGRPKRDSLGKYVPPHTGSACGVRNIVNGQP